MHTKQYYYRYSIWYEQSLVTKVTCGLSYQYQAPVVGLEFCTFDTKDRDSADRANFRLGIREVII